MENQYFGLKRVQVLRFEPHTPTKNAKIGDEPDVHDAC